MNEKINYLKFFFESGYSGHETLAPQIADFFPAIVYIYDVESQKLSYANPKFSEQLGHALINENSSGEVIREIIFKDDFERVHQAIEKICSDSEDNTFQCPCRLNHQEDGYRYYDMSITVIKRNVFGKAILLLFVAQDITDKIKGKEEQEQSIRNLNRSNKDLEEFAYVASHDLQEPLRKISMFSERLKQKLASALDQESESFIDRIIASSNNMRVLIDNLLEFSRINRGSDNYTLISLDTVLDQVRLELELKIEETGSHIQIATPLPSIQAGASQMKQLFCNLLSNAIKFRKSNVPAVVTITSQKLTRDEKKLLKLPAQCAFYKIEVQDNGIGFEAEYADTIFQIFQRLHGKSEYPGSGIGLAICKKIVDNHNGRIFAHSEPEKGTTFTIVLPENQL